MFMLAAFPPTLAYYHACGYTRATRRSGRPFPSASRHSTNCLIRNRREKRFSLKSPNTFIRYVCKFTDRPLARSTYEIVQSTYETLQFLSCNKPQFCAINYLHAAEIMQPFAVRCSLTRNQTRCLKVNVTSTHEYLYPQLQQRRSIV